MWRNVAFATSGSGKV